MNDIKGITCIGNCNIFETSNDCCCQCRIVLSTEKGGEHQNKPEDTRQYKMKYENKMWSTRWTIIGCFAAGTS